MHQGAVAFTIVFRRPLLLGLCLVAGIARSEEATPLIAQLDESPVATQILRSGAYVVTPEPDEVHALYAGAIMDRVEGRVERSAAQARACYEKTRDDRDMLVKLGASCQELVIGSHMITDDLVGWARESLALQAQLQASLSPLAKGRPLRIAGFGDIDFQEIADSDLAAEVVPGTAHETVLPRGIPEKGAIPPSFPFSVLISINGEVVVAHVDTGSSVSALNAKVARDLHLPVVTPHYLEVHDQRGEGRVPTALVEVADLAIGDVHLRNVGLLSSDSAPTVIGLDLIRKMSPVLFSERSLTLFKQAAPACKRVDVHYMSDWTGDLSMMADLEVDGKPRRVQVSTGEPVTLAARVVAGSGPGMRSTQGPGAATTYSASYSKTLFMLGDDLVEGEIWPDYPMRTPYRLGRGILATQDLWIDTVGMKACLAKRQ